MKTIIRNLKLWIIAVAAVASAACSDLLRPTPAGPVDYRRHRRRRLTFRQVMALYTAGAPLQYHVGYSRLRGALLPFGGFA
ncbi:hypothetical protein [Alistipes putredinis]|uniref:hypothetical protein n=1 Tax=Alistipes putredinis TaxID=28117 RepID=UPI003995BB08